MIKIVAILIYLAIEACYGQAQKDVPPLQQEAFQQDGVAYPPQELSW